MGAIAGIIHLEGEVPLRDQVQQLGHGLGHRGPDDKGVIADGRAVFAHRRTRFTHRDPREPLVTPELLVMMD
ncbi:MAG: asparagine synthetase B, partial [Deltaproteobacteria bacterium]|nr:asparagine synthetase B [Deltaproteobacteria bacterium]